MKSFLELPRGGYNDRKFGGKSAESTHAFHCFHHCVTLHNLTEHLTRPNKIDEEEKDIMRDFKWKEARQEERKN